MKKGVGCIYIQPMYSVSISPRHLTVSWPVCVTHGGVTTQRYSNSHHVSVPRDDNILSCTYRQYGRVLLLTYTVTGGKWPSRTYHHVFYSADGDRIVNAARVQDPQDVNVTVVDYSEDGIVLDRKNNLHPVVVNNYQRHPFTVILDGVKRSVCGEALLK